MGRIRRLRTSVTELMMGVISLVKIVRPEKKVKLDTTELPKDEDDVIFLRCAIEAESFGAKEIMSY